jgi:hypothetical protein
MPAQREACRCVVPDDLLSLRRRRQFELFLVDRRLLQRKRGPKAPLTPASA